MDQSHNNNTFFVPYHETHSLVNMENPTLGNLTNTPGSTGLLFPHQQNHHNGIIQMDDNPYLFDPRMNQTQDQNQFVQNNNNCPIGGNFEAGSSSSSQLNHVDQVQIATNEILGSQNYYSNDAITLTNWPQPPIPFSCSCCLVLREIVHTNGFNCRTLEIHGRPGMITHLIQYPTISTDYSSSSNNPQYQMIDFCRRSIDDVKNYLVKYCMRQTAAGYFTLQDPLSAHYEALCTGMEWTEESSDDTDNLNVNNSGDDNEQEANNGGWRAGRRSSLSIQRDRAGNTTLDDFTDYFHLPIGEASRQINLCITVIKNICRRDGLDRWPHRKVKSIAKKISALRKNMESKDVPSRERIQEEISRLEEKMRKHCAGRYPTGLIIP